MSEVANGLTTMETQLQAKTVEEPKTKENEAGNSSEIVESDSDIGKASASTVKEDKTNDNKDKGHSDDFVLISDDEGENSSEKKVTLGVNGDCSPNGVESIDSESDDDIDDEGEDSADYLDDEVEITGVSMAHNEFGTVGGMDQLLRTLIDQGWTEAEIMQQLRGMIAPYQRRQRLNNFSTIDDVVECIKRVDKIIIVSGAGISVSCGIPDFRSETGLYARLSQEYPTLPNPTAMFDLHYFINDPKPFYTFAKEIWPGQFEPSPCHRFIKMLETHGKLLRNYTQNIDTLEQVAGIERVIQCHGSFATASCIYCQYQVPGDEIKKEVMESKAPICPKCMERKQNDGEESYAAFAKAKYIEIKKKLRRRERLGSSSGGSSASSEGDADKNQSMVEKPPVDKNNEEVQAKEKAISSTDESGSQPSTSTSQELEKADEQSGETVSSATCDDKVEAPEKEADCATESKSSIVDEDSTKIETKDKENGDSVTAQPSSSRTRSDPTPIEPLLKPDIVFFGEDLPRNFFDHAEEDLEQAELIIVIGSSMKVKPVASIPEFVQENTPRVLINREPVRHISFDVELLGDADEIVQQLCHKLEWESPVDGKYPEKKRPPRSQIVPIEEMAPLPTRSEVESATSRTSNGNTDKDNDKGTNKKEKTGEGSSEDRHEYEEPCPLFGARCQCPISWNIGRHLPGGAIVKMQPNTFIFPGANVMHPKHVFPAVSVNDSYTVDSDSDLGGFENPIEVSSSDESIVVDDDDVLNVDENALEKDQSKESATIELSSTNSITSTDKKNGSKSSPENDSSDKSDIALDLECNTSKEPEECEKSSPSTDEQSTSIGEQLSGDRKRPSSDESHELVPSKLPRLSVDDSEKSLSTNDLTAIQIPDKTSPEVPSGDGP